MLYLWAIENPRFSRLESVVARVWTAPILIMPDIDPAALSRPSLTNKSPTPVLPTKSLTATTPVQKSAKFNHVPPRIDLEPLYTAVKSAIGENWGVYKESIGLFLMGM